MKKTFVVSLLLILIFSQTSLGQNLLKNPSFERGSEFWTTSVTGRNAKGSFSNENFHVMKGEGVSSLKIAVGGILYSDKYAVCAQTNVTLPGSDSLYMFRFWGKVPSTQINGKDTAALWVTVKGETTNIQFHYRMRNVYQMYHLPFKTHDKNITIKFGFGKVANYYLDGMDLVAESGETNVDVRTNYIWNWNRKQAWGWNAGDNDVSLKLPDGRTIWFFNDSFYGKDYPGENVFQGGSFLRNAMAIQDKNDNIISQWHADPKPYVYFPVKDTISLNSDGHPTNFVWVGDALYDATENKVKVYLVDLTKDAVATTKSYIAELSYPELKLGAIKKQAPFMYGYETMLQDHDTLYLYKTEGDGGFGRWTHVARTPFSNILGDKEGLEYFGPNGWSRDSMQTVRLFDKSAESVMKLGENHFAFIQEPLFSGKITVSFAQHPEGPWSPSQLIWTIPNDSLFWNYMPNAHGLLPNGKYSMSYSVNSNEDMFTGGAFNDEYFYRPIHVQADLLAMSPFIRKDCAGVLNGSAFLDNCQECVAGTTGKTACVTGIAVFYPDCNYGGAAKALKAGEYNLAALTAAGITKLSSLKVQQGYQVELYSQDAFAGDKLTLTSDSSCLDNAGFSNITKSLIVYRTRATDISGLYNLVNVASGKYLDSEDGIANKDYLIMTDSTGVESQKLSINTPLNGFYHINAPSGKALTIGATTNGAYFELKMNSAASKLQLYAFQPVGDGTYRIINKNSDKLLEAIPGSFSNSLIRQWEDISQLSGQWILIPTDYTDLKDNTTNNSVKVYPNPVKNTLYITGISDETSVQLVNLQGQVVLLQKAYKGSVDVKTLSAGVYLVKLADGKNIQNLKVLVK